MALPKIQSPTFEVIIPSINKTVLFRPFLVKEEKILLMAQQSNDDKDIIKAIKKARAVIFPSTCYETFGMVIIEAYACGVAVIGSGHGAIKEIIEDGVTGLTFAPIAPEALAEQVNRLWEHPTEAHEMGTNARHAFVEHYTQENNLQKLNTIYAEAYRKHA